MNLVTPVLAILVPCFNEEDILTISATRLLEILDDLAKNKMVNEESFILMVDDGSHDSTWSIITELNKTNKRIKAIKLSRNFGHQNALVAGMSSLKGSVDCLITIDADLQDDINVIPEMVNEYKLGNHIVYGVRNNRDVDGIFKRLSARLFYKLMNAMKVKSVYNHADFRLVSGRILEEFANFKEFNLYLRGMFPLIGFKSTQLYYDRKTRDAGTSKYPIKKMLSFAWNGITSFSTFPLRLIFSVGAIIFVLSMTLILWALISIIQGKAIPGWASTVIPLFLFGGLQMVSLGLIGEYLGKIYNEVKDRPRFIIEKHLN